jgi:hypothetical protein
VVLAWGSGSADVAYASWGSCMLGGRARCREQPQPQDRDSTSGSGGLQGRGVSNMQLLLTRVTVRVRFACHQAGRAAELRDVRTRVGRGGEVPSSPTQVVAVEGNIGRVRRSLRPERRGEGRGPACALRPITRDVEAVALLAQNGALPKSRRIERQESSRSWTSPRIG